MQPSGHTRFYTTLTDATHAGRVELANAIREEGRAGFPLTSLRLNDPVRKTGTTSVMRKAKNPITSASW